MTSDPLVPGRSCDGCALCCMVMSIAELEKPQGVWCDHCSTRSRCDIYEGRPKECRDFHCGYLTHPELDERWKPSHSKLVLTAELDGNRLAAHVHPNRPSAWREEPYYSALKEWARAAVPYMGQVVVCIGKRTIVILPHKEVDLGNIKDDELIITAERQTPFGTELDALKIHKDDPRAKALASQQWNIGQKMGKAL